jgi:hypothetical protein|tara:strand:- start:8722 stop:9174 length:453 start_codon:yes stop_codon:yes gene_type:complete
MAFNPAAFASAVAQLEANPPPNAIAFANGWADAFYNGFGNPTPPSVAGMLARQAAFGIFITAFNQDKDPGLTLLKSGAAAFAASLALGMLPAFAAIPPSSPCPIWEQQGGTIVEITSKGQAPQLLSLVALQWFSTGTAVNTTSGVTLPWL